MDRNELGCVKFCNFMQTHVFQHTSLVLLYPNEEPFSSVGFIYMLILWRIVFCLVVMERGNIFCSKKFSFYPQLGDKNISIAGNLL